MLLHLDDPARWLLLHCQVPRTANALALTYCHLLMLHRDDFNTVSAEHPELYKELMKCRKLGDSQYEGARKMKKAASMMMAGCRWKRASDQVAPDVSGVEADKAMEAASTQSRRRCSNFAASLLEEGARISLNTLGAAVRRSSDRVSSREARASRTYYNTHSRVPTPGSPP